MFLDVDAAKTLGMNEDVMVEKELIKRRVNRKLLDYLNEGLFKPYVPSRDVQELFAKRAEELGAPNPFDEAVPDVMDRIRDILESVTVR